MSESGLLEPDLISNYTQIFGNLSNDTSNSTSHCDFRGHSWLEAKLVLISFCGTIVAACGIFGNLSTALILTRPSMRSPNNLYLTALAVFDTCLLVTGILIYSLEYIIEYTDNFQMYVAWLTYLRFCFALSHISQTGSVYITVAVTIERYLAVCHPHRGRVACTKRGASISILGVTCFAILFNCTKFFELEIKREPACPRFSAYSLASGPLARTASYQVIYSLWMSNIIMVFFPFITLTVFNSVIAWTIRKSLDLMTFHDRHHERNELKEKSRDATRVLIIIVLMFLICNLWGFVITLLEVIYGIEYLYINWRKFYAFSREAINFLALVNSSINFVIYIIFGKDFRTELIIIYGCSQGITLSLPTQDKFSAWRSIRRKLSAPSFRGPSFSQQRKQRLNPSRTDCQNCDENKPGQPSCQNSDHNCPHPSTSGSLEEDVRGHLLSVPKPHWLSNGDAGGGVKWELGGSDTPVDSMELWGKTASVPCQTPNGDISFQPSVSLECTTTSPSTSIDIIELQPCLNSPETDCEETVWL